MIASSAGQHCTRGPRQPAQTLVPECARAAVRPRCWRGQQGRLRERCKNSGYSGRMAIIEAMTVSDQLRKLIIARANSREMGKVAIGQGMRTLRMVALDPVRDGVSTLEQVLVLTASH